MQLKKGESISLDITKLAFGGAGIGEHEGKVVFVECTVPGDKVTAKITRIKPNFLEAKLEEIISPSAKRITPKCAHFNECGGCALQYLSYEDQLSFKENHVKESLEHIGGFKNPPMQKIIGCQNPWHYRNKMEFSFSMNQTDKVFLGLHPKGYRYDVFELKECHLESEDIGALVMLVQKFAREKNLKAYDYKKNTGLLRTLTVREGKKTGERLVNLVTSHEDFPYEKEFIDLLTGSEEIKKPTSIYITKHVIQKGSRTVFEAKNVYGKPHLTEELNTLNFNILPDAFFQPNTLQAEILYTCVLELGEVTKEDIVYDLFCGTGTIGLFCAKSAKRVFGVDINKSAIENAIQNAKLNGITNAEYKAGDAFEIIKNMEEKPDIVIVDPPRNGLGEALCDHLLEIGARKIVYVSCNPATLSRDLKILCKDKYRLITGQPVDMFPHTHHVETVCKLQSV